MFSMRRFTLEQTELHHDALHSGAAALMMAHISDVHLRRWGTQHDRLTEMLSARGVDFVFLTGDFVTGRPGSMACVERLVKGLQCRYGLFACRGNWEVGSAPPPRRFRAMMEGWGANLLVNESHTVPTHAGLVRIIALDDLVCGWPDFEGALADGARAANLTVLLCHAPLAAALLPEGHGVDLLLSGHTHGAQVRIPLLWPKFLPRCHGGFCDGLYELYHVRLHVSRGFGAVGIIPLRFNCPAQVALLKIVAPPG